MESGWKNRRKILSNFKKGWSIRYDRLVSQMDRACKKTLGFDLDTLVIHSLLLVIYPGMAFWTAFLFWMMKQIIEIKGISIATAILVIVALCAFAILVHIWIWLFSSTAKIIAWTYGYWKPLYWGRKQKKKMMIMLERTKKAFNQVKLRPMIPALFY